MVAVVQLVEHQVVILAVAGSSPVSHPEKENRPRDDLGRFSQLAGMAPRGAPRDSWRQGLTAPIPA